MTYLTLLLVSSERTNKTDRKIEKKGALTRYDRGHFWWVRDTSDRGVAQHPTKICVKSELHQWRYNLEVHLNWGISF